MLDRAEAAEAVRAHAERVVAELREQFPMGLEVRLRFPVRGEADAVIQSVGPDHETLDDVKMAAASNTAALLDEDVLLVEVQSVLRPPAAADQGNGAGKPD